ncbi:MAG: cytochrome P450 [Actinomycetes bacterium]
MGAVRRPPGPGGLALVRAIAGRGGNALPAFFARTGQAHPRLAHLYVPREHVYVLSHPDLVRQVFVAHGRHTVKSRGLENAKILVGDGLLTSEGALHQRQRRLVQPAFSPARVAAYATEMTRDAAALADTWQDGTTVDVHTEMSRLTLTVAGRTLFGVDLRDEADRVAAGLSDALAVFRRTLLPGGRLMLSLPLSSSRRALAAGTRLDALVRRVIDARSRDAHDRGDVLSALLAARDGAEGMPLGQVRDEVMTLLIASHETTAVALSWTWWLLAGHPEAEAALHDELDTVLGGRPPGPDDATRLPVATATVAEAMRLYPPAWVMGRRLTSPLALDGWTVPAGSVCVASQWALHRDGRFWPDPLAYLPARWLDGGPGTAAGAVEDGFDEQAPGQPRGSWFPFGMGARACVGAGFAWTETVLVLATLARSWAPARVDGHAPRLDPAVTLRPAGGLPMVLRMR